MAQLEKSLNCDVRPPTNDDRYGRRVGQKFERLQMPACKWHAHVMKAVVAARCDICHMWANCPHVGAM